MSEQAPNVESPRPPGAAPGAMAQPFVSVGEITDLIRAFEDTTLPHSAWTHRAHLTIALWYLAHHSGREATARIRTGIKRYNASKGILTTPTGGYHETLTMFWTCLVSHTLLCAPPDTSLVGLANVMLRRCGNKDLPLLYYSRDRLMSARARCSWVEPDLRPLIHLADGCGDQETSR